MAANGVVLPPSFFRADQRPGFVAAGYGSHQ
jgi:hypothetical protein